MLQLMMMILVVMMMMIYNYFYLDMYRFSLATAGLAMTYSKFKKVKRR